MLFLAAMFSSLTFAQTKVSGNVKDETGEPLIGASVVVKGGEEQELSPTWMVTSL